MRYMILTLLLIAGCSSPQPQLDLTENTTRNVAVVESYVAKGTDSSTAVQLMSDAGFTYKIERGKTFALSKGTTPIGHVGPMDFVWCEKQQGSPVARRWQVILILDEKDKVKEHSVTSGLVGP